MLNMQFQPVIDPFFSVPFCPLDVTTLELKCDIVILNLYNPTVNCWISLKLSLVNLDMYFRVYSFYNIFS